MKTGTVKWFNARKGYGFLKPGDGGFNVYVHISAVERAGMMDLKVGQKINFEMVMDDRTGEVRAENLSFLPEVFENLVVGAGAIPRAPAAGRLLGCLRGGEHRAFWAPVAHDERPYAGQRFDEARALDERLTAMFDDRRGD